MEAFITVIFAFNCGAHTRKEEQAIILMVIFSYTGTEMITNRKKNCKPERKEKGEASKMQPQSSCHRIGYKETISFGM